MPLGVPEPVVALAVFLIGVGLVIGSVGRFKGGLLLAVYAGYWVMNLLA